MGRLPPFWFGYRYPCTDHYSSTSTDSDDMSDYSSTDSDYADEERDTVSNSLPTACPEPLAFSVSDIVNRRETFKAPPPGRNARSNIVLGTPMKPSMSDLQSEKGVKDDKVLNFLRREFPGKIARGYPVVDFVRTVWKFEATQIPLRKRKYMIKGNLWTKYEASWCKKPRGRGRVQDERGCYKPLKAIFDDLIKQLSFQEAFSNASFFSVEDREVKGNFTHFSPDFAYGPVKKSDKFQAKWEWIGVCGEVKKRQYCTAKREDTLIPLEDLLKVELKENDKEKANSTNTKKRGLDESSESNPPPKRRRTYKHRKPKFDSEGREELTKNDLQAMKYVNELLSHGIRSYSSGFIVRETSMTLWYADRTGLVESQPFNMFYSSQLLLLVVAAIRKAHLSSLGVCPFLKFPSSKFDSYDGAKLVLPRAIDANDQAMEELEFNVTVSDDRSVFTAYGAIGRGTTVVPIEATGKTKKVLGEEKLVAKISWPSKARKGEDYIIKKVRRGLYDGKPKYLKHVVDLKYSLMCTEEKMKLPRASMGKLEGFGVLSMEMRICRTLILKAYLPLEQVNSPDEFKTVFVDTVRAHHYVWQTSGILHRDISVNNIMFYREDGRVIGVLCDWDLAMIKSEPELPPEVKFIIPSTQEGNTGEEAIEGEGNSDSEESADETTSGGEELQHVVTDTIQDGHADRVGAETEQNNNTNDSQHPKARYRTGTGPFMALDLLSPGDTPMHLYRHDLESFFYVLVWFCVTFRPKTHKVGYISSWQRHSLVEIGDAKLHFLMESSTYEMILAPAHRSYVEILTEWVQDLRPLFLKVSNARSNIQELRLWLQTAIRRGDQEEETSLRTQLVEAEAARESMITYEDFMKRIGMDV
ncbi:hypothetical protein AcV7_001063 [Taiwanofungus camphoratus]|nr:hypothetical protein AcV7_001063 [Antrodia cinnamomea]